MKANLQDKIVLSELTETEFNRIQSHLTLNNPKFDDAIRFNRSTRFIDRKLSLYKILDDSTLTIPRGADLNGPVFAGAEIIDQRNTPSSNLPD